MKTLFALSGLLFFAAAAAQDFKITHGPYLCDMTRTASRSSGPPANRPFRGSRSRLTTASFMRGAYALLPDRRGSLADRTLHAVRIKGLKPGTDYCYRIFRRRSCTAWPQRGKASTGVSPRATFSAANPIRSGLRPGADCSFIVFNDIHGRADYMAGAL